MQSPNFGPKKVLQDDILQLGHLLSCPNFMSQAQICGFSDGGKMRVIVINVLIMVALMTGWRSDADEDN